MMLHGPKARGFGLQCPRDRGFGTSYVDALDEIHTGPATVMLSWVWKYSVRTVVTALVRWCARTSRDPPFTYVWQCALCCLVFACERLQSAFGSGVFHIAFSGSLNDQFECHVIQLRQQSIQSGRKACKK